MIESYFIKRSTWFLIAVLITLLTATCVTIPVIPSKSYRSYANSIVDYEKVTQSWKLNRIVGITEFPSKSATNATLGSGWVIVDMGKGEEIVNGEGHDLRVYEADQNYNTDWRADLYRVFVSNDKTNWHNLGYGRGVESFDLAKANLQKARYVKIKGFLEGSTSEYAGPDIEAIEALHMKQDEKPPKILIEKPQLKQGISFTTTNNSVIISGTIQDDSTITNVSLNDTFLKLNYGGNFETKVVLKEGENIFILAASDSHGNTSKNTFIINRLQPVKKEIASAKKTSPKVVEEDVTKIKKEIKLATSKSPTFDYSKINFGNYHALVIGNNNYLSLPKLKTAKYDAQAVADILKNVYGFSVSLIIDATRSDILLALSNLRKTLTSRDNLLIYYGGHGWLDNDADEGYWLPIDADKDNMVNWVSNSSITATLRAIEAKHVLVVADSCYSGKLGRGLHIRPLSHSYLSRISQKKARSVLSSGGLEPVLDSGGKENHSVFASAFLEILNENTSIIDGTQLFSKIRRPVMLNSDQTPEYSDIRKAGHDGGDFLFVRKRK